VAVNGSHVPTVGDNVLQETHRWLANPRRPLSVSFRLRPGALVLAKAQQADQAAAEAAKAAADQAAQAKGAAAAAGGAAAGAPAPTEENSVQRVRRVSFNDSAKGGLP